MKIALYIFKLGFGGAERVVCRTSQILERNGHEVFIITDETVDSAYEYAGQYLTLNIPHSVHGVKSLLLFKKRISALKKLKKQYKFDCVISFLLQPNIVNILSKVKGCKTYVSIRNRFISENYKSIFQRLFLNLAKKLYKKSDGVISVSNLINEEAVKYLNVPPKKSFTLYNPYDIKTLIEESNKAIEPELESQLSDKSFKYVSTGRFTHQKGFWHLIKAFAKIHSRDKNTKLVLIGDGELKEKTVQLIKKLQIEDSVILPGFRKDVFAIEKYCNAYVMTSLFEGFPNALTEAMCLGLPVISSDCKSGPKEILVPKQELNSEVTQVTEQEYGILIPAFLTEENWISNDIQQEEFLVQAMEIIKAKDKSSFYSEQSKLRSKDFSEEKFFENLMNIITVGA